MNRKSKHTEISEICISPTEIVTNIADLLNKHFTEIGQKLASEIPEPPGGINFESCLSKGITNFSLREVEPSTVLKLFPGGGGGGGAQQSFIRGGSAPRSKPLPFYVPFLIEKVPLLHTSHRKWYPFHIPFWGFKIFCPFQIPKWQFSLPFPILELVKFLPFHVPQA